MNAPLVEFDNVVKRFGDFVAVERMNLQIQQGEFVAIMGSSGCGKTTTLRMLAGLENPSQGEIRLAGRSIEGLPAWQRDTPMVWQSLALFPFLSVVGNVEFALKMRGIDGRERRVRAMEWLERLGIAEFADRNVSQLSGGQRQRVALARSLVTEPQILLLDEPLSALDANLTVRMQAELTRLQRELGITFVYVTHSQSEAFAMADRVVIMSQGRVEQIGTPKEIYRNPHNRFVAEFIGANNIISGKVKSVEAGVAAIASEHGTFKAVVPHGRTLSRETDATFVISADRVEVATTPNGGALPCVIVGEEFVGSMITLYLETESGLELKAQSLQDDLEALDTSAGARLFASWSTQFAHILPGE